MILKNDIKILGLALHPNNETKEKPSYGHCTPIMGQEKNPLMRPVFCTLQETGHLISVES